ncbi:MAG: hypothetical protein FWE02_07840 [Defluviitaleaceae bacterium]|nr:hypothetical protein [Defluviitaleaceae bacterium]
MKGLCKKSKLKKILATTLASLILVGVIPLNLALAIHEEALQHGAMDVTTINQLEVGVRHYLTTSNGEIDFMIFLDEQHDSNDNFVQSIIQAMGNLSRIYSPIKHDEDICSDLEAEIMQLLVEARDLALPRLMAMEELTTSYWIKDSFSETDVEEIYIESRSTTIPVSGVERSFFNQRADFRPPATIFYSRSVGNRFYQGYLSLSDFTGIAHGGSWHFTGRYSGTLFSGETFPIPWDNNIILLEKG